MTNCPRCGKTLHPDSIHTCSPKALVLADELRIRCRLSESCLPEAEYRTRLTALHDDMLDNIEAAHAVGIRQERELMECEALLRQVLNDICGAKLCEVNSMSSRAEARRLLDKATDAIHARLEVKA